MTETLPLSYVLIIIKLKACYDTTPVLTIFIIMSQNEPKIRFNGYVCTVVAVFSKKSFFFV